jgi:hypothetical protein
MSTHERAVEPKPWTERTQRGRTQLVSPPSSPSFPLWLALSHRIWCRTRGRAGYFQDRRSVTWILVGIIDAKVCGLPFEPLTPSSPLYVSRKLAYGGEVMRMGASPSPFWRASSPPLPMLRQVPSIVLGKEPQ